MNSWLAEWRARTDKGHTGYTPVHYWLVNKHGELNSRIKSRSTAAWGAWWTEICLSNNTSWDLLVLPLIDDQKRAKTRTLIPCCNWCTKDVHNFLKFETPTQDSHCWPSSIEILKDMMQTSHTCALRGITHSYLIETCTFVCVNMRVCVCVILHSYLIEACTFVCICACVISHSYLIEACKCVYVCVIPHSYLIEACKFIPNSAWRELTEMTDLCVCLFVCVCVCVCDGRLYVCDVCICVYAFVRVCV